MDASSSFLKIDVFGHVCSDFSFWGKLAQHNMYHIYTYEITGEIQTNQVYSSDDITHQHVNRDV